MLDNLCEMNLCFRSTDCYPRTLRGVNPRLRIAFVATAVGRLCHDRRHTTKRKVAESKLFEETKNMEGTFLRVPSSFDREAQVDD